MKHLDTQGLVEERRLRDAAECFREAGERGLSRKKLADALGASVRTADRARALLAGQGAQFEEIATSGRSEKRFRMTRGPSWDTRISKEARLALRVAAQALSHGGGHIFADQLTSLESLAEQAMTTRDRMLFENLRRNVRVIGGVGDDPTEDQARVLEAILMAFSYPIPRELDLVYRRPGRSSPWSLRLAPYCLTQDMFSGGTFLLGWQVDQRKLLQLRTSRILEAKVSSKPGIIPNPDLLERAAQFQVGGWVSTEPPFEVRVRIRGANWVQSMEEAQPDFPGFRIILEPGGSAVVSFQANQILGPKRWVLQMGADAEVLAPPELAQAIQEAASAILLQNPSSPAS